MLSCHVIGHPDQKQEILPGFIEEGRTWIVNDLETKFWMQSVLRDHHKKVISGDLVLRASELWQQFLMKLEPEWQSLSGALAQVLIEEWMREFLKSHELNLSSKDCRRAYQTMGQILPLLSHFQGEGVMDDWFGESEEAKERWYDWYQMGSLLWARFEERKMIPQEWMKGLLVNRPIEDLEHQNFVFDLGLDFDDVESELILNLSRVTDVDVIIPAVEEGNEAYRNLLDRCQPNIYESQQKTSGLSYKKLPSMLSEVKEAVGQVRAWLDEGIELDEMAIVSMAIENYWPTLSEYLKVEGIPANKPVVTPLSQIDLYQSWLSKIRLGINQIKNTDGEQVFFCGVDEPLLNYETFNVYFKNVYDVNDYHRLETVKENLPEVKKSEVLMSFNEFLQWAFELMDQKHWPRLSEVLGDFDEVIKLDEKLEIEKWLQFVENYFSRTEKKIEEAVSPGLVVTSLSGALNRPLKKMMILGLSENLIKEGHDTALLWTDIESIKIKFGFSLPHADRMKSIDRLKWLQSKDVSEIHFTHGETDFSGQFQAPSIYWLQGALAQGHDLELHSPRVTRWDQLMNANPSQDWQDPSQSAFVDQVVDYDLGKQERPLVPLEYFSLSASSIEEYFKCPFRFYAQRALHLSNLPSLDLDIDAMTKGRLIHKIAELIKSEGITELNDEQVDDLVERSRQEVDMSVYNSSVWNFLKPLYIELTKNFLQFEKEWLAEFPATETFAVEKKLETRIGFDEKGMFFSPAGSIAFRGVIDRIDRNSDGQYVILDYKSGGAGLTQYGSWLKNGKLQLALYSLALIEGAMDADKKDVVGAFYYVMKNLERTKGFVTNDANPDFLKPKKMSKEDLTDLLDQTRELVGNMILDMKKGAFSPKPHDDKYCDNCDWNKICRYPKLNH